MSTPLFRIAGPATLDRIRRELRIEEHEYKLTTREFELLDLLMESPGNKFSNEQIRKALFGEQIDPARGYNRVAVLVNQVRTKIGKEIILSGSKWAGGGYFVPEDGKAPWQR